jgi:hypothetical protein
MTQKSLIRAHPGAGSEAKQPVFAREQPDRPDRSPQAPGLLHGLVVNNGSGPVAVVDRAAPDSKPKTGTTGTAPIEEPSDAGAHRLNDDIWNWQVKIDRTGGLLSETGRGRE